MKLINNSKWDTNDLRRLIYANIIKAGMSIRRKIEVSTTHSNSIHELRNYSGRAGLNTNWINLTVPKPDKTFNPIIFSQVLQHELAHNRGLRHKEMLDWWTINQDWAKDFIVNPKIEKPIKPKTQIKEENAIKMFKIYQTKLKRTKTILKKWERKVKYYQKKNF